MRSATPIVETHKATLELGPGVVDGRLLWTSASGLTKIDTESTGGCPRRWFFEQVMGKRQPSTEAQRKGTKLHGEIEGHLITGAPLLTPLVNAGRHYIPERGPGILIEHALAKLTPEGTIAAWLRAADVPLAGHVDIWNHRGIWIDPEGELRAEPRANTLETKDWKTTSDLVYAKSAAELAKNVQMVTYAEAGFRAWTHLEHARLTHVYFRTRGAPVAKLSTVLCDREQIARRWEYVESLARLAADVARETNPDKVPANRNACGAYRGCPHQSYCSVGSHDSLADVFGPRGADQVLARMRGLPNQEYHVALIDKMSPGVVVGVPMGTIQTMPASAGVGVQMSIAPAVDVEMARLQAEEAARRAQAAAGIPPGFAEALNAIRASGYGHPAFVGRAATAVAQQFAMALPQGAGINGVGWLAEQVKQPIEDPAMLLQLAAEVATLPPFQAPVAPAAPPPQTMLTAPPVAPPPSMLAAPTAQPTAFSVLPPDAPQSDPALAAKQVDGFTNTKAAELAVLQAPPTLVAPLQATAQHVAATGALPVPTSLLTGTSVSPPPAPQVAVTPTPVAAAGTTEPSPVKKGPGRPKGSRKKTITTTVAVGDVSRTDSTETVDDDVSINVYVNAIPSGAYDRLESYIELACKTLCDQVQAADIQCAPKDSALGYGKWQGALASLVRDNPPAPGDYVVKASRDGNDPASIVVKALRAAVESSGGQLVEGVSW